MVSFSCEACGDVVPKKKLDGHRSKCHGASFTCLDCMVHFHGTEYRSHTSCISEAQKYQGHLYREPGSNKKAKTDKRQSVSGQDQSQAMVPRGAYVEDVPEGDDMNAVAVIDVPPRAPTPPSAVEPVGELPSNVNVFDFLVGQETPGGKGNALPAPEEQHLLESANHQSNGDSQFSQFSNGDGSQYKHYGYSYGNAPIQPGLDRFESWTDLTESQQSQTSRPPLSFATPAPKDGRKDKKERVPGEKSEKKRKRGNVDDLNLSSSKRPASGDDIMSDGAPIMTSGGRVLHSGLTGGLSRLITDQEFYDDRVEADAHPISPVKRSKREKDPRDSKDDRRKSSYTSHASSRAPSSKVSDDRSHRSGSAEHARANGKQPPPPPPPQRSSRRRASYSSDDNDDDDDRSALSSTRALAPSQQTRAGSVQPTAKNQLVTYSSRAELFMSFVTKGPASERGCSVNKALKRYHRERDTHHGAEREEDDKELWKSLRVRRNSRGEIVLFV